MLRIRSDDQLVALFREGSDDAFRVIHDRYRGRLHAYTRQMLAGSPHDSEDALQEIFVRAYYGLRANRRDLALRPWLYRVAHNRCVDELRRMPLLPLDPDEAGAGHELDPAARVEQRDALRRLIADVQRLPDQQRSALLMRELSGMSYNDVAASLGVSVAAVKSLLVRARVGLAQANEARDTACGEIREELIVAHDRGVRASGLARRHMAECDGCRSFRREMRGQSRQLAALVPTLGPVGVIAQLLGIGGGGGAAASGGVAAAGGVAGGAGAGAGAAASAGLLAGGAGHVVSLIAAAVVTAGGAVELQKTIIAPAPHHARHHLIARAARDLDVTPATSAAASSTPLPGAPTGSATAAAAGVAAAVSAPPPGSPSAPGHNTAPVSLTQILDPDHLLFIGPGGTGTPTLTPATGVTAPGPANSTSPGATAPAAPGTMTPPNASGTGSAAPSAPGTQSPSTGATPGPSATAAPATSGPDGSTSAPSSSSGAAATSPSTGDNGPAVSGQGSSNPPAASGSSSGSSSQSTVTSSGNTGSGSTTLVRPRTKVARTVAAGSTLSGRVVSFMVTRRHAPHHYALGTLAAP